jgi:hypothetical protein
MSKLLTVQDLDDIAGHRGGFGAAEAAVDEQTLIRKLADARQEVRNLIVMQMRPGQSAEKVKLLHNLERSARAETKLRVRALAYHRQQRRPQYPQ